MRGFLKRIIISTLFLFASCKTPPLPPMQRDLEPVSQAVYATNDSISLARFDLAASYSAQTVRLVDPPKQRISIKPLRKTSDKNIYVVVPAWLQGKPVLVVDSKEYEDLIKQQETSKQLLEENQNLEFLKSNMDKEIRIQTQTKLKVIKALMDVSKELEKEKGKISEKNNIIFWLIITLTGIVVTIVAYITLKIKNLLPSFLLF